MKNYSLTKKTIGNWFCPLCHAENEAVYSRCTICKRGEKTQDCIIQSPKKMTSIKEKNRAQHASEVNGDYLQKSPSVGGVMQKSASSGGDRLSRPVSSSSVSKNGTVRDYQTVKTEDPNGNIIEVEIISHVCKWSWIYCSGFCEGANTLESKLYDSKVDLFFDLVEDEVIVARDTIIVSNVVYNDEWLNSINIGLSLMGLLSEPMKRDEENGFVPLSKSGKREKKKEQSATKIEALKQRMTNNTAIMNNLKTLTPTKKKTNSKAQKVRISIYGGSYKDEDDEYDEEDEEFDSEEYADEAEFEDENRKSHEWVRMIEHYDEEAEIAKILEEELQHQNKKQEELQPAVVKPIPAQREVKKETIPLTFAQLQQQQMKNKPKQNNQPKQPQPPPQPISKPKQQPPQSKQPQTQQSKQQPKQQQQQQQIKQQQPKYNKYDDYDDYDYDY